jgi:hypothetical protein
MGTGRSRKERAWRKFLEAYRIVRREFYTEVAVVLGGNVTRLWFGFLKSCFCCSSFVMNAFRFAITGFAATSAEKEK